MPSPFPGMDPYLENSSIFPDLHDRLISNASQALNATLPAPYYSGISSRIWVETSSRRIEPDVDIFHPPHERNGGGTVKKGGGGGGVALATKLEFEVVHAPEILVSEERRETFLEIYAKPKGQRLVTSLEILSISNKTPGEQGRSLYKKKQAELLLSDVHLVEIDLLRAGEPATALPAERFAALKRPFDYHVCVHRYDQRGDLRIYSILLSDRLPIVEIPLLPGDEPVRLDLQALPAQSYDNGLYARRVRYADERPEPPLNPEQAQWAEQCLREKGLL